MHMNTSLHKHNAQDSGTWWGTYAYKLSRSPVQFRRRSRFARGAGYTSGPEHHIHTIQPISITRALHAFKWNRHDRQICVITVTRSKLHMHRVRPSKGYQVFNSHIGRACPSHCDPPESGGNNDNRMCQSCMQKHRSVEPVPSILNQFLPFCLGVHGTQEPRADETAR